MAAKKRTVRQVRIESLEDLRAWLGSQLQEEWDITLQSYFHDSMNDGRRYRSDSYSMRISRDSWKFATRIEAGSVTELYRKFVAEVLPKIDQEIRDRALRAARPKLEAKFPRLTHEKPETLLFT